MDYAIEIIDNWGRCIAAYDDVPLLDVVRSSPDDQDEIRGLLPFNTGELSNAYQVRVYVDGVICCEGLVEYVRPQWSDTRKLILDKYVAFHEVLEFAARSPRRNGNAMVSRAYKNREIGAMVKDILNSARGPIHYWVDHKAYPEGAEREYMKFLARKTDENELETGGIAEGQWVGGERIDIGAAYAKDGDTIAGLVVDGEAWPDLRLMLVDAEETALNAHAESRHPEVAFWTDDEYDRSVYKRRADAAKAFLQQMIDEESIEHIELNPHRNAAGEFDDRVDAYGRYVGLVYGGGKCFNAALVEQGLTEVYLYEEGKYHVPEMALKDFYSYVGCHKDSIEATGVTLGEFDVRGGVLEVLTALAYAAGGFVFSVDVDLGVRFRRASEADRVLFHDPVKIGVRLGSDASSLRNILYFKGNPFTGTLSKTYACGESIDEYGIRAAGFEYFSITAESDADKLAAGLLDDVSYPEFIGAVTFFHGEETLRVGDIIEVRGEALRRFDRELPGEWDGRFAGKLVGCVRAVGHRFTGKQVTTTAFLTSPLRSVVNPLSFMVRSQPGATTLFEFRLDDDTVGLDMGFHLD